ncbi:hypothetical protein C8R43DRAFT_657220 [Mycena crocata]|nr:hypothetical protein C8R43DRAFT_657220 [Mycena crocata]
MAQAITHLPTELLHEIFSITTALSSTDPAKPASDHAPWILGHICRRWRQAVISHSEMWCTILIRKERPPSIDLLTRQLQLGAEMPLTITFYQSEHNHCLALFEALVACSSRWRQVSLAFLHNASPFLSALERVRGQIPILRTLNLEGSATTTGNPFAFEIAPELQDLIMNFRPMPIIPWPQLARLSINSTFSPLLPILELAQNLTELTVNLLDQLFSSDLTTRTIHLPLVSRCLIFSKRIMDMLILPQLEITIVELETSSSLVSLIERSSCHLKKLGLYGNCFASLQSLLQACPTLAEMSIVVWGPEIEYLTSLIAQLSALRDDDSPLVVPRLKNIFMMVEMMDQTRFVDMIESRWRVPNINHRLEQVTVILKEKWEDAAARKLLTFQEEGLKLQIPSSSS